MELLERSIYLTELDGLLRQAIAGRGHLLFLGGEAGVGKSALVRQFASQAESSTRVLAGACDSLSTPRPLGPLLDIAEVAKGELAALLQASAPRSALFSATLAELLAEQPTLVVIEDAHWADEATLDLLRFLGRRIGPVPALIIVTYRDDELGPGHPLRRVLGDLATAAAVRRLGLRPLSVEAVSQLSRGSSIDAVELFRLTGGNPFFITEVLSLGDQGLPSTVRDAVLARTSRLSSDSRHLLDACAVIGSPIEPWLLQKVSFNANLVADCVDVGILTVTGPNLAYRHELARQAVLETLDPISRQAMHARVLEVLIERPSEDPARLAHHAEEAGDRNAVLTYAEAAARNAAALSAHREAAAQYRRALRFAQDQPPARRADLLKALSQECFFTDQMSESLTAIDAELELIQNDHDPLRQSEVLIRKAKTLWRLGNNEAAGAEISRAIEILEPLPASKELAAAYSARAGLLMVAWRDHEAIRWGEKAIELARQLGETETVIQSLNSVGSARTTFDDPQGDEDLKLSLELALEHGFEEHAGRGYSNLASSLCLRFKFLEADPVLDQGIRYCTEHDVESYRLYLQSWKAFSLRAQGHWTEAADLSASLLRHPTLAPVTRIVALTTLGHVRVCQGIAGADDILDEALDLALPTGEIQRLAPVRVARAEAAWLAGDRQKILSEIAPIYDEAIRTTARWQIGQVAFWLWRAGERSEPLAGSFEPFALQIIGNWSEAAARWRALGCPYEAASALADSDDESDLRYALSELTRLGAAPMAAMVSNRLRALTERRIRRRLPAAPSNLALPETRYASSGSVNIAYQVVGDGPLDLVFVMGWISNVELFWEGPSAAFLRRLASFSRLIVFDKRGTGLSDRIGDLPTIEQRMDDVRAVMDAAGSERAALFGISEGAAMCAVFAATYPQKTSALIVYGGYAKRVWAPDYPWAPTPEERQTFYDAIQQGWGGVVDLDTLAPSAAADPQFRDWWASYLRRSASPGAALALARMNTEIDIRAILPAIRVPTLILHRTGDTDINVGGARYLAEHIPDATYVEFSGNDHLIFAGDQDAILDEVELFLTGTLQTANDDRVLTTIVSLDIAGIHDSTSSHALDTGRHVDVSAWRRAVEHGLAEYRGDPVAMGDSRLVASFDGPGRAIRFACAVAGEQWGKGLAVRAGLHTGECERSNGALSGAPLDVAAEIVASCAPGEIVAAATVKDLVAGSGISFEPAGMLLAQNFPDGLPLYRVVTPSQTDFSSDPRPRVVREPESPIRLSRRERQIAALIVQGLSNRQIAAELSISPATAERHVSNIFNKLGFHSRAQIAAWAVEHAL